MAMRSAALTAPVPADGFEWVAASWGLKLVAHALKDFKHGWTTRQLQLRGSPDVERAGWASIARSVGVTAQAVVRLRQVHGVAVHRASAADIGTPPHEADVISTDDHAIALAVQVADCVPLLFADRRRIGLPRRMRGGAEPLRTPRAWRLPNSTATARARRG